MSVVARTPVPALRTPVVARQPPTVVAPAAPVGAPRVAVRESGYVTRGSDAASWWEWTASEETSPELAWPTSVKTFERMRRTDAQVTAVLRAVALPLRRAKWFIDPAGASDEVVALVAEDLGLHVLGAGDEQLPPLRSRDRFSWAEHLRQALEMLTYGHAFFEQQYRIDEASGYARLRKLAERPAATISAINVADDGGLVSIQQRRRAGQDEDPTIAVNRLVAYVHERTGGNWRGVSLLRPAYKHWLLKDRLLRVQTETIERNGMGVPRYTAAEGESDLSAGRRLAQDWRSGVAAGGAVPFGAHLDLVGVTGTLPDAGSAIRQHDESIGRAVLAHFLNLDAQGGSYALAAVQENTFTQSLQATGEQVADVATQHVVEDMVDVNFGPTERAPRVVFEEIGSRQQATAQAIKLLVDAGVLTPGDELEQAARSTLGLPSRPAGARPAPPPPTGSE